MLRVKVFKSATCSICNSPVMEEIIGKLKLPKTYPGYPGIVSDSYKVEVFDVTTPDGLAEAAIHQVVGVQLPFILIRQVQE